MAIVVLRPGDLVKISKITYGKKDSIEAWGKPELVDSGFFDNEKEILEHLPSKKGRLLLLGSGGGRDAIAFSKVGFSVTAIDFIPEMAEKTMENAQRHRVRVETRVQEIFELQESIETPFDYIWFSASGYSSIPTCKRRIAALRILKEKLQLSGLVICLFHWTPHKKRIAFYFFLKKLFAFLTLGYFEYEKGDMLWGNIEFIHSFSSETELNAEFKRAGFEVVKYFFHKDIERGSAILKKIGRSVSK